MLVRLTLLRVEDPRSAAQMLAGCPFITTFEHFPDPAVCDEGIYDQSAYGFTGLS